LIRTEKVDIRTAIVPVPIETQTQIVKDVEIRKPEPPADITSRIEINNLVAWERLHAEEQQVNLPKTDSIEPVQRQPILTSPNVTRTSTKNGPIEPQRLPRLIDIIDKIPDQLDTIPQSNPEAILKETEQDYPEARTVGDLETPALIEYFDIEDVDLESTELPLTTDDTHLETGIVDEYESNIDLLVADLEDGMQQVEAEYIGELLVDMFAVIAEAEGIVEAEGIDVQLSQTVPLETTENTSAIDEATEFQGFEKNFSLYLESLEPEQIEATRNIIEELSDVLKESQQLPEETPNEIVEIVEQKLEELCIQLFEGLGLKYDDDTIKRFLQRVTEQESFVNVDFEEVKELSIEDLNKKGTREYQPPDSTRTLLGTLAQYIKQKMQPKILLGRYALRASAV